MRSFISKYKFSFLLLALVVILFCFTTNRTPSDTSSYKPSSLTIDQYHPIDDKIVTLASFFSSINKEPIQLTSDPLYKVAGDFLDINKDGKKELIARENWPGASGWSDAYNIFEMKNLIPQKIFSATFDNSFVYFNQKMFYEVEPYYEENKPLSEINKVVVTIYEWQNNTFEPTGQEIIPINLDSSEEM